MSAPSIILVGAGGYLGKPVTQELLAHRSRFNRIAILTQDSKKAKFAEHEASGFELVIGALDSTISFKGTTFTSSFHIINLTNPQASTS